MNKEENEQLNHALEEIDYWKINGKSGEFIFGIKMMPNVKTELENRGIKLRPIVDSDELYVIKYRNE